MKISKSFKSSLTLVFAFGFLFAVATTSCGPKKSESDTEQVEEHPAEEEHPTEGGEHPSSDEHPSEGGEHPSND
ncbi:hypothetical protein A33Q_3789 [Indibacter alkaliphilus LW1]|uniref:Uncharacterized protein n=1 Tax=Indibacter alkaliphilus (strain CCUG 57479 / KCTC 22604 / LW1) TaxID=1189612 RepID=S2D2V3_INDAL|nr:hypothetical protein [Indibacter alkaliphilus]EOZ93199.1 hypothetical protein A33Q_3789 [Indibacter alkaliphilus LW1]